MKINISGGGVAVVLAIGTFFTSGVVADAAVTLADANPVVQAILGTSSATVDPTKIKFFDTSSYFHGFFSANGYPGCVYYGSSSYVVVSSSLSMIVGNPSPPLNNVWPVAGSQTIPWACYHPHGYAAFNNFHVTPGAQWKGLTLVNVSMAPIQLFQPAWVGLTWRNDGSTPITVKAYGPSPFTGSFQSWIGTGIAAISVSSGTITPSLIPMPGYFYAGGISANAQGGFTVGGASSYTLQPGDIAEEVVQFNVGGSIGAGYVNSLHGYSFSIIIPDQPTTHPVTITATAKAKPGYKVWFNDSAEAKKTISVP